ncbi:MAG: YfcE family phosphodiesterase [Planctomycetota bacterium]|nr:YfcE family phosphodiesterase [Planctomycetota bacterium]
MRIAVVSDTHGQVAFTRQAIERIRDLDVSHVLHCGDIGSPAIPRLFTDWPTSFVFGNVDSPEILLRDSIQSVGQTCFGKFGSLELGETRIAITHGHDRALLDELISGGEFDLVCYGHTHQAEQHFVGHTLVLNPGALYRASPHSFAIVDLPDRTVEFVEL